ncbi:11758_t:CDS:2, partial [Dentiscutata erythropus]
LLADPTLDPLGHRIFIRKDPKPDRTKAMEWEKKRMQKQIHIQNAGTVIHEINGGTFENINGEIKPISKEKDDDFMSVGIPKRSLTKKNNESAKTTKDKSSSSHGTSEVNSSGYGRPYTPPHQIHSAPRSQVLISPHKPTLYVHTAKYLAKHFSISINQGCVITKTNQVVTIPSEIRHWLIDSFSVIQATCIKDVKSVFTEFDFTLNKVNGIGFKTGSNKELVFIEVSGGPENPVEKHVKEDTEKLIKEAMFGLISLLRDYLDKNA